MNRTFEQWWFHGYWNYPPPPDEIMQLPAGGAQTVELACNKVRRDSHDEGQEFETNLLPRCSLRIGIKLRVSNLPSLMIHVVCRQYIILNPLF